MQRFKFLTKAKPIEYNGEWSQNAIQLVREHVLGRFRSGQRVQESGAEYVIADTTYQRGDLVGAVVKVYPIGYTNTTITYWISMGRVTPFITDHNVEHYATI
jgi:hypothetical protein